MPEEVWRSGARLSNHQHRIGEKGPLHRDPPRPSTTLPSFFHAPKTLTETEQRPAGRIFGIVGREKHVVRQR